MVLSYRRCAQKTVSTVVAQAGQDDRKRPSLDAHELLRQRIVENWHSVVYRTEIEHTICRTELNLKEVIKLF